VRRYLEECGIAVLPACHLTVQIRPQQVIHFILKPRFLSYSGLYVLDVDDVAIKSAVVAAGGIKPLMIKARGSLRKVTRQMLNRRTESAILN